MPAPPKLFLAVFKSFNSVQLVPFQDSFVANKITPLSPPNIKPEVLTDPADAPLAFAAFKSPTSVQLDPFQDSVKVDPAPIGPGGLLPVATIAAV